MYCPNCRNIVDESWEFCPICGKNVDKFEKIMIEENYIPSKKEKKIVLVFLGCLLTTIVLNFITFLVSMYNENMYFISYLKPILYLIALTSIIYGRIKYPKNNTIKTIITVSLILISLYLLWKIIFIIVCGIAIGKMS